MRRSLALATSALVAATGLQLAGSVAADAAATCTYTPVVPKRVYVNQSVVGMRIPLRIVGPAGCQDPIVSTYLVHGTDRYYLSWLDPSPDNQTVYAGSIVPGVYRTTASDCDAFDSDFNRLSCSVTPAATVIKFAGRASLTAKRKGKRVTLTVRTSHFDDYDGSKPTSGRVTIQRLSGTKWRTIKHATARGKAGYTWTFTKRTKARYRVVASETGVTFATTSRSVKR